MKTNEINTSDLATIDYRFMKNNTIVAASLILLIFALALLGGLLFFSFPIGNELFPISLAIILGVLIAFSYILYEKFDAKHNILSPLGIFLISYFLLYVIMCFDLLFLRGYAGNTNLENSLANALQIAILGLVVFMVGYILPFGKNIARLYPVFHFEWDPITVSIIIIALIGLSGASLWIAIKSVGGFKEYLSGLVLRRFLFFNQGYLLIFMDQIHLALFLAFSYWLDTKRGAFLFFITALMSLVILLSGGSREMFFCVTIALFYIYISKGNKISNIGVFILVILLLLFAVLYGGYLREYIPYGKYITNSISLKNSLLENIRVFWDRLAPLNFDSLYRLSFILQKVPGEVGFLYGKSFLGIISFLIPRALYPDKPVGIGMIFTKTFYPLSYINGSGETPSLLVDFYWNYGLLGVIFGMIFFGILLRSISTYSKSSIGNSGSLIISAIFISQIFGWLKAGSDTPTQIMVGYLIFWIFMMVFFHLFNRKKRKTDFE